MRRPSRVHARAGLAAIARVRAASVLLLAVLLSCSDRAEPGPTSPVTTTPNGPVLLAPNVVPTAQFAVSPRWPAPGDTVTFDARYSHDNDGQVVTYRWAVSNGVTLLTGSVGKTVFRTAGTYTVTLTTYDNTGDSASTTLSLPVGSAGVPAGAVDAAQSHLVLASSSVGGGAGVVATVTAKTAGGSVISSAPVAVAASGLRVAASPIDGTTNGSGVWTSTLSSGVAQSVVVRAVANFTALTDTVPLTITSASPAAASAVRVTQATLTNMLDSSLVEVTARDTAGNPIAGAAVTVSGSPAGLVVSNEGTTDANGRRVVTVKSTACSATHTLTIVAGGVTLSTHPTVQQSTGAAYTVCGPTLWLDANDVTTFTKTSGGRVSEWRDKSGMLRHGSAAGTARPTYTASTFNGRTAVVFAGGTSATSTPEHLALAAYPGAGQSAMTYLVVYRRTASNSCDRVWDFGSGTTAYEFLSPACVPSQRAGFTTTGTGGEMSAGGSTPAMGTGMVTSLVHDGTLVLRVNAGASSASGAVAAPSALGTPSNNWIGRSQFAGDGYLSGEVAELIGFPRALSNAERLAVEQALMIKWGIGTLAVAAGNSQSATAGTSPTNSLQVRITDASGNGLAGATVVWQVTGGGGRVGGNTTISTTTDASGYATLNNGVWKLDYGSNQLTAWYNSSAGSGQSVVFTGTGTLPANLVIQYDANNAATMYRSSSCSGTQAAVGDSVGCWKNTVTGTKHVTQSTAGYRPTVATFASTGRASLKFVLTRENWLETTATGIDSLAYRARTIVAVAKANATEDNNTNAGGSIVIFPGWHSGLHFYGDFSATDVVGEQWMSGGGTLLWSSQTYATNTPVVATQVLSTSSGTVNTAYANGSSLFSQSAAGTPSAIYGNLMRIGQANVSPDVDYRFRLDGQIAEIMIFNRALTNAERLQVEQYMGWKWGITVP